MYCFCTHFDHNYLSRGLALYKSLERVCSSFHLWILCQDSECYRVLAKLALPSVTLISQDAFGQGDEALQEARGNRTTVEFYFTCTPTLPLYIFRNWEKPAVLTYLDADLFFFTDPTPLFDELAQRSIGIIEHRFLPHQFHWSRYGIYNVGWLSFRRDASGLTCLNWWRERCLEWCFDRVEAGKYADQGYLNDWPERFTNVAVLKHPGANLAPWNVARYKLEYQNKHIRVDDAPLIFYHFQGVRRLFKNVYETKLLSYGLKLSPILRQAIYQPYVQSLHELEETGGIATSIRGRQFRFSVVRWIKNSLLLLRSATRALYGGQIIFIRSRHKT